MIHIAKSQKNIVEGDCYVDRISGLPNNVIECIMKFMPARDAARTCVLSRSWKYTWADHPILVLDNQFWNDIQRNTSISGFVNEYAKIVSSILLHHVGYIRTFVIHAISALSSVPHINMDVWLSSLCRRGLKELTINMLGSDPYRIPSEVYSSSDLIKLSLFFCTIKSGCFTNIQSLSLHHVIFGSSVVLETPFLENLRLEGCYGVLLFDISAPRLKLLVLHDNDRLNLKPFLKCTGIRRVSLSSSAENAYFDGCKSFCFPKLLVAWPRISQLGVDEFCFKYLATGSIPPKLDQPNLRSFTIHDLKLDSKLMPWILWILKNCPLLRRFKIWFGVNDLNGGMTDAIDESRSVLDFQMDRLHTISMKGFTATPNEVVFAKILLQRAPVLEKMLVEENDKLDPKEHGRIFQNLLSLQRAFPKPRIVFRPN